MRRISGIVALVILMAAAAWLFPADEPAPSRVEPNPPRTADCRTTNTCPPVKPTKARVPNGSGFDFYVLSLSWSPSFCAGPEGDRNPQQCGRSKDFGLIVHGLWPQNEKGYPEFCASRDSDRVPDALGRSMFDIMPSMGLIGHEWRKHGSCSGLSQRDYFATVRSAWNSVTIPSALKDARQPIAMSPAAIETAFTAVNPGLSPRAMAVTCDGGKLEEIRICLSRDLSFRDCPAVDRQACSARSISLPPVP